MVRLKEYLSSFLPDYPCYFNSNMVRLKDKCYFDGISITHKFQFQHGAIKSDFPEKVEGLAKKFQFQHGAIKRLHRMGNLSYKEIFQFQHGSD